MINHSAINFTFSFLRFGKISTRSKITNNSINGIQKIIPYDKTEINANRIAPSRHHQFRSKIE